MHTGVLYLGNTYRYTNNFEDTYEKLTIKNNSKFKNVKILKMAFEWQKLNVNK